MDEGGKISCVGGDERENFSLAYVSNPTLAKELFFKYAPPHMPRPICHFVSVVGRSVYGQTAKGDYQERYSTVACFESPVRVTFHVCVSRFKFCSRAVVDYVTVTSGVYGRGYNWTRGNLFFYYMSTKDVFLSYGREPEVTQFVVQLKCDLESHGIGVWLDTDDIPAGSDWHGAIGKGLHNCRALVAVITKKYINSRFCSSELYTADGDRKLIFPVIYEDVDFGASDTGMGVKYVISGINWSMFRPRIDDYVASLYKLIEGLREKGRRYIRLWHATPRS